MNLPMELKGSTNNNLTIAMAAGYAIYNLKNKKTTEIYGLKSYRKLKTHLFRKAYQHLL